MNTSLYLLSNVIGFYYLLLTEQIVVKIIQKLIWIRFKKRETLFFIIRKVKCLYIFFLIPSLTFYYYFPHTYVKRLECKNSGAIDWSICFTCSLFARLLYFSFTALYYYYCHHFFFFMFIPNFLFYWSSAPFK